MQTRVTPPLSTSYCRPRPWNRQPPRPDGRCLAEPRHLSHPPVIMLARTSRTLSVSAPGGPSSHRPPQTFAARLPGHRWASAQRPLPGSLSPASQPLTHTGIPSRTGLQGGGQGGASRSRWHPRPREGPGSAGCSVTSAGGGGERVCAPRGGARPVTTRQCPPRRRAPVPVRLPRADRRGDLLLHNRLLLERARSRGRRTFRFVLPASLSGPKPV